MADANAAERSDAPAASQRLRPAQRIKRNTDFGATRAGGRRIDGGMFQLIWRARGDDRPTRVGVVASRAAVGNAVQRARAKRRLREAFRRHQHRLPRGLDLILTARSALLRCEFTELEQRFLAACAKIASAPHA